jgi:anaerobic ribonucleoside-triphosphate reductase activating protein
MNISITFSDYPDNESLATIIYFDGCIHNCINCQNKELQIYKNKESISTTLIIDDLRKACYDNKTNKIVFSGGDPLYSLIELNDERIRYILYSLYELKYEICIYTGYDIDTVKRNNLIGFKYIKCGRYNYQKKQASEKTDGYIQFASNNQELYDSDYHLLSKNGLYNFKENN